jgi:hypothetical protein
LKKLSLGALSQQLPLRLIEAVMPYSVSWAAIAWLAYWLPRSLWKITPAAGLRRNQAIVSASVTMSAVIRLDRPAHDLPVEQVQHDGQVQPAFAVWM